MNRKGFMMAEVVVVSAIVMVSIVGLYQSYNKIYSAYTTRIKYYDSTTLYRLGYYRDILITNNVLEPQIKKLKNKEATIIDIYNPNGTNLFNLPSTEVSSYTTDTVFLVPTNKNNNKYTITANVLDGKNIHQTFKDYLSYLSTSTSFNSNYLMLMERCNTKDEDKNDCYYAYLEIYDGEE